MKLRIITVVLIMYALIDSASGQDLITGGYYCHDSLGVRQSINFPEHFVYRVGTDSIKRFPRRNRITLRIEGYTLGSTYHTCNAEFSGKIKNETPILNLGNDRGVQFTLGRTVVGGEKRYVFVLSMWEYKPAEKCWMPLAVFNTMTMMYSMEQSLAGFSVGFEGTPEFMKIEKGFYSLR